jgi:hypothetical protein
MNRTLTGGSLILLLAACAATAPAVPPALQPGADATLVLSTAARGVQIYECRAGQWAFVAPQAELFDTTGRPFGTHGAGPFWQASDGSRVVASVAARADAPSAGAIPWLLLAARSESANGTLAGITRIQRVNTAGGSAPGGSCDTPGRPLHVPYSADYHFYRSQP